MYFSYDFICKALQKGSKMAKLIDLTGLKFGRLTVVGREGKTKYGAACWLCKCECGNNTIVIGDELRKGSTRSCGCLAKELTSNRMKNREPHNKSHGKAGTRIYKEWIEMKRRCTNTKDTCYKRYGARGIKVCEEWLISFEAFYNDVSKLPHFGEKGYSLDRIDNNGNYEPNNVRWADSKTQANNRRNCCYISYKGEQLTIKQLAERYGVSYNKLYKRIKANWNIDEAINTP